MHKSPGHADRILLFKALWWWGDRRPWQDSRKEVVGGFHQAREAFLAIREVRQRIFDIVNVHGRFNQVDKIQLRRFLPHRGAYQGRI